MDNIFLNDLNNDLEEKQPRVRYLYYIVDEITHIVVGFVDTMAPLNIWNYIYMPEHPKDYWIDRMRYNFDTKQFEPVEQEPIEPDPEQEQLSDRVTDLETTMDTLIGGGENE